MQKLSYKSKVYPVRECHRNRWGSQKFLEPTAVECRRQFSNGVYAITAVFAAAILSVGVISVSAMNHEGSLMSSNCPVTMDSNGCAEQPADNNLCINYHLGLLQNFSNALPKDFGFKTFGIILAAVLVFAVFGLLAWLPKFFLLLKIRLRRLLEETIGVFYKQLGFWLDIIQKRDPAYAFASA